MPRVWKNVAAGATDDTLGSGGGDQPVARPNEKIVIRSLFVMAGATATSVTLNSKGAGAGTAIGPAFSCGANGGLVLPPGDDWLETKSGEALTVTTGAGSTVGIIIEYEYKSTI